jgi:putative ABC transport system substrate-binding protein
LEIRGARRSGRDGRRRKLQSAGSQRYGRLFHERFPRCEAFRAVASVVPAASRFAMLVNLNDPTTLASDSASATAAASAIGCQVEFFTARTNEDIDAAFARMVQWRAEALLVGTRPLFAGRAARQLATSALFHRLPVCHFLRETFIEAGGLMSYGSSLPDSTRLAAIYVGRVLKGEKPADLPVMQPTRFEFVLNLATAKVLGLTLPPLLIARADEVFE